MTHYSDAGAQRFFEWLDAQESAVRPTVSEPLRAAGYVVYHTGGGCLAWFLELSEDEYLLITWNDSLDGDPEVAEWAVGRYHDDGGWVNLNQSFTLREAMEVATRLPAPRRVDGSMIEEVFDTLDEALHAVNVPVVQTTSLDVGTGQLVVAVHRGRAAELIVTLSTESLTDSGHTPRMTIAVDGRHVWGRREEDAVWPVHLGLDSFPDAAAIERGMLSNLSNEWHATAVDAEGHVCDTRLSVCIQRRTGSAARIVEAEPCPRCSRRLVVDGECLACAVT